MDYTAYLEDFSISAIAESGQCFRINSCRDGSGDYTAVAFGKLLRIHCEEDGRYTFSCSREEFGSIWSGYFDLGTDYGRYRSIVLPDDEYLKEAVDFGMGIRILNQDPWETLVSFIISQRKSVPAIRTSVERLANRYGSLIEDGYYSFPEPGALAEADEEGLGACGLGYRTGYVRGAARAVHSGELDLNALRAMDTRELEAKLMELKGVGIKVASCAALFGYHRLDIVPVDVWMKRVIGTVYGGKLPEEYSPYAGVLQQYLFNYARINKTGAVR